MKNSYLNGLDLYSIRDIIERVSERCGWEVRIMEYSDGVNVYFSTTLKSGEGYVFPVFGNRYGSLYDFKDYLMDAYSGYNVYYDIYETYDRSVDRYYTQIVDDMFEVQEKLDALYDLLIKVL